MNRSVANIIVGKFECTEREKRLRNLLIANSGLRLENGRWLDRQTNIETIDTEQLLIKVLKAMNDRVMGAHVYDDNRMDVDEDVRVVVTEKRSVNRESKRLFTKRPNFTDVKSVREFILQMGRTIVACDPSLQYLNEDFSFLAYNYGLTQDAPNVEVTRMTREVRDVTKERERLLRENAKVEEKLRVQGFDVTANKAEIGRLTAELNTTKKLLSDARRGNEDLLNKFRVSSNVELIKYINRIEAELQTCRFELDNYKTQTINDMQYDEFESDIVFDNEYDRKIDECESQKRELEYQLSKCFTVSDELKNTQRVWYDKFTSRYSDLVDVFRLTEKRLYETVVERNDFANRVALEVSDREIQIVKMMDDTNKRWRATLNEIARLCNDDVEIEYSYDVSSVHLPRYAHSTLELPKSQTLPAIDDEYVPTVVSNTIIDVDPPTLPISQYTTPNVDISRPLLEKSVVFEAILPPPTVMITESSELRRVVKYMQQHLDCPQSSDLSMVKYALQCVDKCRRKMDECNDVVDKISKEFEETKSKIKTQFNTAEARLVDDHNSIVDELRTDLKTQLSVITNRHEIFAELTRLMNVIREINGLPPVIGDIAIGVEDVVDVTKLTMKYTNDMDYFVSIINILKDCVIESVNLDSVSGRENFRVDVIELCDVANVQFRNKTSRKRRKSKEESAVTSDEDPTVTDVFARESTNFVEYPRMQRVIKKYSSKRAKTDEEIDREFAKIASDPSFAARRTELESLGKMRSRKKVVVPLYTVQSPPRRRIQPTLLQSATTNSPENNDESLINTDVDT
ncbi:hypothetical protein CaLGV022 [Clostera anastomosis granulovirus A]|uniref:Uncharacterized protein n=1 Tax=Clostera anastomosis granulovirus A TaxID=1986289 RepID=U5KB35_9BBAC|nr:hypothetical protein CaLGV022 [Clostera anastomosis granulovirus Henan]AGQ20281.1 hypothetical protein CaLGV022 [Clostera anastomosis granulovirus Henan]